MQPVLPPAHRAALFSVAATRLIEQRAAHALPAHALMRRAGDAIARLALALAPHARQIWIAAGPGNNGGDGLEAAAQLVGRGKRVHVTLAADVAKLPADANNALMRARAAGVSITVSVNVNASSGPELQAGDIAIDALLGIGASRAPDGHIATLIDRLNALACPVLAVDLPSGLNADTGQALGSHCVVAQHTAALLTLKPGLFTAAGRDHAGTVWLDPLGVSTGAEPPTAWLAAADDVATLTPARRHAQHKGSFGDVVVVGGATGMAGAALLAARAAHAAGAGRVYVTLLATNTMTLDMHQPELMFRSDWLTCDPARLAGATVVCGCGGGEAVRDCLPRLLSRSARLVLDADALNAIAADTMLQTLLTARHGAGHATVLTPHPLEAARLLNQPTASVQADRLGAAALLAERFGCVVLLKGSGSVVAAAGRIPSINATGSAALASAGTGDVLAGWLGGLWSQMGRAEPTAGSGESAPPGEADAFRVAVATAFMHGTAADRASTSPVRASHLIGQMLKLRSEPHRQA